MQDVKKCCSCQSNLKLMGDTVLNLSTQKRKSIFNISNKTLYAQVYQCEKCGKLEMFNQLKNKKKPVKITEKEIVCDRCDRVFETKYEHCPYCGWEYDE